MSTKQPDRDERAATRPVPDGAPAPAVDASAAVEAEQANNPVTMSAAVLKALSNPLRRRILNALAVARSGRAADLAEKLEIPANKLSFHLRVLAEAGLIKEDPALARDRRDRVWVAVRGARTLGSPEEPMADAALGQAVLAGVISDDIAILQRIAAWVPAYTTGEDPVVRGTLTDSTMHMSRERFETMVGEINEVIARHKQPREGEDAIGWNVVILGASEEI